LNGIPRASNAAFGPNKLSEFAMAFINLPSLLHRTDDMGTFLLPFGRDKPSSLPCGCGR